MNCVLKHIIKKFQTCVSLCTCLIGILLTIYWMALNIILVDVFFLVKQLMFNYVVFVSSTRVIILRWKKLTCACAHQLLPVQLCMDRCDSAFMHMHVLIFFLTQDVTIKRVGEHYFELALHLVQIYTLFRLMLNYGVVPYRWH